MCDEGMKDLLWFLLRRRVLCVLPAQGECRASADGPGRVLILPTLFILQGNLETKAIFPPSHHLLSPVLLILDLCPPLSGSWGKGLCWGLTADPLTPLWASLASVHPAS